MATADGSYKLGLVACGHMTRVAARKKLNLQRHLGGLLVVAIPLGCELERDRYRFLVSFPP